MSLIKQNRAFSHWDYLFIAAGLLAGFGFFMSYSSQDPRSAMETSLNRKSATLKAAETLNNFGYSTGDFNTRADYMVRAVLFDSLQYKLGRPEAIRQLQASGKKQVFPFVWRILFYNSEDSEQEAFEPMGEDNRFGIRLDEQGHWVELRNGEEQMPDRRLNRAALQYAFQEDSTRKLWRSIPDSAWDGVLSFDVENGYDVTELNRQETEKPEDQAHIFSPFELKRLGEYYLNNSAWDVERFILSEVRLRTLNGRNAAVLNYQSREDQLAQKVELQLTVLPTGSILSLTSNYNTGTEGASRNEIWILITTVAVFILGIIVLISFFLRIRARVVDTKSALVISIVAGLLIPITILLENLGSIQIFEGNFKWLDLLGVALQMGIMGAIGSVGFFVLASIGDSVTREYWQQKLACYDYIRQGMLFNRPVGEAIMRSVVLMFILAGIWSLLLWLVPEMYFHLNFTYLAYEAAWPPLFLFLQSAWFSLLVVLGIFLVTGSLVYSRSKNKWIFAIATVVAFALIAPFSPLSISFGPIPEQYLFMGILGLSMVIIYLSWDFLTLLVTHFLFVNFVLVAGGWLTPSSPDLYLFVTFNVFLLLITGWAVFSIVKGKEEQSLPKYVPEYVEELAQEERIKQELQIARNVQQSFLPAETPDIKGLDLAALCQPAYETGGDYYDFIKLDDHRVALTIGDVSGKGIQAAFYMTFTKGILHSLCRETDSPAELLIKANRLFCDNASKGTFISLVYGIIDLEKNTFTFARAGHNPILHINSQTGKLTQLQPNGLGLGLTRNSSFDENIKEVQLALAENDLLVLYTDGIVEALNDKQEFYGDDRLLEQLQNKKENSSREILDMLSSDVSSFIGSARQHDDMTIMVIKMNNR